MVKKIILFDPNGEDVLLRTKVLDGLDYRIYDPENDIKYNAVNIMNALFYCFNYKPKFVSKNYFVLSYLRILWREFRAHVVASNIRKLRPAVVLTWIDNSDVFHRVCKVCIEIPFISLANGARTTWCATTALPDAESKYYIDEYFCYGPRMKNMFEKYGHQIKKYYVTGSLTGGYYFSSYKKSNSIEEKPYDICLVSQWHINAWSDSVDSMFSTGKALDAHASFVARYANDSNIKVCVALRSKNPDEKLFYNNHFSGECYFQECDRESFSSYKALEISNLVIAINSSLSVEAFGAGLKVLFFNFYGQERIRQTDADGCWYLSEPTYEQFSDRVSLLLEMNINDYALKAKEEVKNIMTYDFNNPTHLICRNRLIELVRNS